MIPPHPTGRRPSTAHTWLRILFWIFPGLSAPFLFAFLFFGWPTASVPYLDYVILAGFVALVIGCGIYDGVLALTRRYGRSHLTGASLAGHAIFYVLTQLVVAPAVAVATLMTISVIRSAF